MMRVVLTVLLFFFSLCSYATEVVYDSSTVLLKKIPQDVLKVYEDDKSLNYELPPPAPKSDTSLFSYIIQRIDEFFDKLGLNNIWDWIIYIVAAAAVITIIVSFMKTGFWGIVKGKSTELLSFEEQHENIHEMDFGLLIRKALEENDYRYAIRLQYLQLLKNLTAKGVIDWKPGKTNREYLRELYNKPFYNHFRDISRVFEFVWYGEIHINEREYVQVAREFDNCNKNIGIGV